MIQVCTALLPTCFLIISSAGVVCCCLLLFFWCLIQNTVQPPTSSCSVPYLWTALRWSISHQFGMHLNALGSIIACAKLPSSDALIWLGKKKTKKRPTINNSPPPQKKNPHKGHSINQRSDLKVSQGHKTSVKIMPVKIRMGAELVPETLMPVM